MCGKMNTAARQLSAPSSAFNRCFLSAVNLIASLFSFACHAAFRQLRLRIRRSHISNGLKAWSNRETTIYHVARSADCHFAAARATMVGYEVAIDNSWVVVPADRILERVSNPTGRAVVCIDTYSI